MAISEQQRQERRSYIGASDAAAACGLAPASWGVSTPLQLYRDKRGELPDEPPTLAMRRGTALEPVILQAYSEQTGSEVSEVTETLIHPDHPWMACHVDGIALGDDRPRLVEAKSADWPRGWGAEGTGEIPIPYLLQVQHMLHIVLALPALMQTVADVAVLVSGEQSVRIYQVAYDPELASMIVAREAALWAAIQAGEPPPPSTGAEIEAAVGRSQPVALVASEDQVETWRQLVAVRRQIVELETERDVLVDRIKLAMGAHDALHDASGRTLATWRSSKTGTTLDGKRLAAEHPEIVAQYQVERKPARPFLVKEET